MGSTERSAHREVKYKGTALCEPVNLLSLKTSETWLDMALSNLSYIPGWCCCEQVVGLDDFQRCLPT